MPRAARAYVAQIKYAYQDYDTDIVSEAPPVQNNWYEVFHAYDVRLIWCTIIQENDEVAAKDLEIRWTIDGNVYLHTVSLASGTRARVYRSDTPSLIGTSGLWSVTVDTNAGRYVDKRGLDFKVEVRITSPLGTNQTLESTCVRETLEAT